MKCHKTAVLCLLFEFLCVSTFSSLKMNLEAFVKGSCDNFCPSNEIKMYEQSVMYAE